LIKKTSESNISLCPNCITDTTNKSSIHGFNVVKTVPLTNVQHFKDTKACLQWKEFSNTICGLTICKLHVGRYGIC